MQRLTISHPYGAVGKLPWQDHEGVPFGHQPNGLKLLQTSAQIKTFTEQVEDEATLHSIGGQLQAADTVVYEDDEERETYFALPSLEDALEHFGQPALLVLAVTTQATLFAWPLKLPAPIGAGWWWGSWPVLARLPARSCKTR